jgi:hypothetical protein
MVYFEILKNDFEYFTYFFFDNQKARSEKTYIFEDIHLENIKSFSR